MSNTNDAQWWSYPPSHTKLKTITSRKLQESQIWKNHSNYCFRWNNCSEIFKPVLQISPQLLLVMTWTQSQGLVSISGTFDAFFQN